MAGQACVHKEGLELDEQKEGKIGDLNEVNNEPQHTTVKQWRKSHHLAVASLTEHEKPLERNCGLDKKVRDNVLGTLNVRERGGMNDGAATQRSHMLLCRLLMLGREPTPVPRSKLATRSSGGQSRCPSGKLLKRHLLGTVLHTRETERLQQALKWTQTNQNHRSAISPPRQRRTR